MVCRDHLIKYKVTVNNVPVHVLYDTGTLMSCIAKRVLDTLPINTNLIPCNRYIACIGGEVLRPVGKCFVQLQIGKKIFRDRVLVIENLWHKYMLGQVLHRSYEFGTGYLTTADTTLPLMDKK